MTVLKSTSGKILVIAGLILAAAAAGGLTFALGRVGIAQGYAPEQPIAFSHELHAGQYKVPCLYCHFGAEKSRHAGIPPSGVCMNCHTELDVQSIEIAKLKEAVAQGRPIVWVKVHNLPDFVYFNHAQHVMVAELECQQCHGPVEEMDRLRQDAPLTMGWCLDCHRRSGVAESTAHLHPQGTATGGEDCSKCHY